jgi:glycosyltransferase involved in cell wall biosynthesis
MRVKREIKVLHIMKNIQKGGVEQFILNQYEYLANQNVVFDFCVFGPDKEKNDLRVVKRIEELGGRILFHPYPNKDFFLFLKKFKSTLKDNQYDVVHCHQNYFSGVILPLAKSTNVPIRIAHAHTAEERKKKNLKRKVYQLLMRKSIHKTATHLLASSRKASQFLYGEKSDAEFLPNGINAHPFIKTDYKNIRKELSLPEDTMLLGHVGNFKPMKNHVFLLDIFKRIRREYPNTHLLLVGEGETKNSIETRVKKMEIERNVHFLGSREDIGDILQSLNVFLFPSLFEGLGISVIEAQAAGINAIISDHIPNEVDLGLGLLTRVSLNNYDKWTESIIQILSAQPSDKVSNEKREEMLQKKRFDSKSSSHRLLQIYEESCKMSV